MKKTILITLIVNMFLLMAFDVMVEYNSMKEKVQNIESSVSNSVDSAIDVVLGSEEFFSHTSSYLSSTSSVANISVWNGSSFTVGNLYLISEYMNMYGYVPSQASYNSFAGSIADKERFVYEKLYGDLSSRQPTESFRNYYNSVGKYCNTSMGVVSYGADGSRIRSTQIFPSLSRMGLSLDGYWNTNANPYSIGTSNQFMSPINLGRNNSRYYLTPASLGVTYLDEDLLRNTIYCILDTQIRCNKVTNTGDGSQLASASGTVATQIADSGVAGGFAQHRNGAGHTVVNDGQVQYFLDTLDVDVTYYVVDWWNNANWEIVSFIEGAPTSTNVTQLPSALKQKSTKANTMATNYVVVAKVDVSVMISLPHNSWVLQWNRHRQTSGATTEYYGVRGIGAGGSLTAGDTGLVYRYSTFCAVTE